MIAPSYMTDTFKFQLPRKIIFGNGAVDRLGSEAGALLPGRRVLVVTDPGVRKAGLIDRALASFHAAGFEVGLFDQTLPDSPLRVIEECVARIRRESVDLVCGIGGGSPMDTAKAAALLAAQHGDLRQYLGIDLVPRPGIPFILVPTTAGTGSEISNAFVVADEENQAKFGCYSAYAFAEIALIDPELMLGMPRRLTAESGVDALCHGLESFVSSKANMLSDMFAYRAVELIAQNLLLAYEDGSRLESRYAMSLATCLGTMAIRSSGLGLAHAASNPLVMHYHISHGCAIALVLPAVMEFNAEGAPGKFAALAEAFGAEMYSMANAEAAKAPAEAVRQLIAALNLPQRLRDVGGRQEDFASFAQSILKRSPHLLSSNPRPADERQIVSIYERIW